MVKYLKLKAHSTNMKFTNGRQPAKQHTEKRKRINDAVSLLSACSKLFPNWDCLVFNFHIYIWSSLPSSNYLHIEKSFYYFERKAAAAALAPSGGGFSLGVEVDGSDGEAEIVVCSKGSSIEAIPWRRRDHRLSARLLEKNKHEPVDSYVWPRILVAYHLFSCVRTKIQNYYDNVTGNFTKYISNLIIIRIKNISKLLK